MAEPVRRHVGLLLPSSNTTIEYEYPRFGPAGVAWHSGRLRLTEVSPSGLAAQETELAGEAAKLGTAHPELVLLCQSAIGFVGGAAYERALEQRVAEASGAVALSAARTMVAAVRALGAVRIGLATPFASAVDGATAAYFGRAGLEVVGQASLGMTGNHGIAAVTAEALAGLVRAADGPLVQAIVVPGGNLETMALLSGWEAALGKPVVVTNQACLWAVAGILGAGPGVGWGALAAADADGAVRRGLVQGAR